MSIRTEMKIRQGNIVYPESERKKLTQEKTGK